MTAGECGCFRGVDAHDYDRPYYVDDSKCLYPAALKELEMYKTKFEELDKKYMECLSAYRELEYKFGFCLRDKEELTAEIARLKERHHE